MNLGMYNGACQVTIWVFKAISSSTADTLRHAFISPLKTMHFPFTCTSKAYPLAFSYVHASAFMS